VLSACGGAPAASDTGPAPANQPAEAQGMTHSSDPMSDNSYDVHFIDSMLDHHAGVIAMAEQALKESQTVSIKDLAQASMTNAQKEIDWLKAYRQKNHPNAAVMKDSMNMGSMGISGDATKSFDQRYAQAMIEHHQGSIAMAKEALTKVGHDDLKQFIQTMLAGEEAEVTQLQQFLK
jgi:uncharacterized protein (DUF305 family)